MTTVPQFHTSAVLAALTISGFFTGAAHAVGPEENTDIPVLSCKTPPSFFNTGYDQASGTAWPNGAPDPQWFVAYTRSVNPDPRMLPEASTSTWKATSLRSDPNSPGVWINPNGYASFKDANGNLTAQWISANPGNYTDPIAGAVNYGTTPATVFYRTQFRLAPEIAPTNFKLDLWYYTDDNMQGVFINHVAGADDMQALTPSGFGAAGPNGEGVPATLTGPWQAGLNTVTFSVKDQGWQAGLLARSVPSQTSFCVQTPISIAKTSDKTSYMPGDNISYTVVAENLGLSDVAGNSLADATPAGVQNPQWACTSSLGASGSCPAAPITAPISFAIKASEKLSFTLTGTTAISGSLLNNATLTPGAGGTCAANTGCTASVTPTLTPIPDLAPTWTTAPASLTVGQPASYTVQVANSGGAANTDGSLTIALPANMAFSGAAPAGCTVSGATMACSLQALAASGGSASISFSAQASAAFSGATMTATITSVTGETVLTNNTATTPVAAVAPPVDPGNPGTPGTASPAPVPSLGFWGAALLSLGLALAGVAGLRKRRAA